MLNQVKIDLLGFPTTLHPKYRATDFYRKFKDFFETKTIAVHFEPRQNVNDICKITFDFEFKDENGYFILEYSAWVNTFQKESFTGGDTMSVFATNIPVDNKAPSVSILFKNLSPVGEPYLKPDSYSDIISLDFLGTVEEQGYNNEIFKYIRFKELDMLHEQERYKGN